MKDFVLEGIDYTGLLKPLSESAFLENPLNEQFHVLCICKKKLLEGKSPTTATRKPTLRKTVILHLKSRIVLAPEGI